MSPKLIYQHIWIDNVNGGILGRNLCQLPNRDIGVKTPEITGEELLIKEAIIQT